MIQNLFVCALLIGSMTGCKQGIGDSCQVNSDCASGACSMAIPRVCVAPETVSDGGGFDTKLPMDALRDAPEGTAPRDAAPRDAAIDASIDAAIDAAIDSGP